MVGVTDRETALATDWLGWAKSKPKLNEVKPVEDIPDWMTETIEFNQNTAVSRNLQTSNVNLIPTIKIPNVSTAYTSISLSKDDWSTAYTVAVETGSPKPVSKYMNTTQDTRPVHIYFMPEEPDSIKSDSFKEVEPSLDRRIVWCGNWNDMADMFKLKPKSICVNAALTGNQSLIEIINMFDTFSKLVGIAHEISVTLGVNKDTEYSLVKESQKLKILGIIPASKDFGLDETLKGTGAQWNNIPYWPKHIIEQLPGAKKTNRVKTNEIKLTPRQEQILFLIRERGSSNKVIAKTLNITESTVKLHVGLVLKKFGVKNRTQLAVFSKK